VRHGVYHVKVGRRTVIAWIANPVNAISAHIQQEITFPHRR